MNDRTPCATPEARVTYLYEECDPAERKSLAAHVAICSTCSSAVGALSDTRAHLASWSPPSLPLGFQITRTESDQPAKVLDFAAPGSRSSKSGGWWRQPLPAWAQAAAAVFIFAAGMSVNSFRSPGAQPARAVETSTTPRVAVAANSHTDDLSVTREEFARLDSRLRAIERADVTRASYVQGTERGTESEDLRAQLTALRSQVALDRKVDEFFREKVQGVLTSNRDDINAIRETTQKIPLMDEELQGHRQVLLRAAPGLAVRTALTSSGHWDGRQEAE